MSSDIAKPPVKIPPYRKPYNFENRRMLYSPQVKQFPLIYVSQVSPLIIGWGAHLQAGVELKNRGVKNALVVSTGLRGSGILDEVVSVVKQAGVATTVWAKAHSNPRDFDIEDGIATYESEGCDGVLSVGGGSSHDTAKLIRVRTTNKEKPFREMIGVLDPPWQEVTASLKPFSVPHVAINSTTGTGAESTAFAVVTEMELKWKGPVIAIGIEPALGINDPAILRCQPERIAAQCGIDCLLHGYGGLRTRLPNEITYATGLRCSQLCWDNLPQFVYNRWNDKACEAMTWAQFVGSTTYAMGGGCGMVHAMAHQLSAVKDLHHGLTNAIFLVGVERMNIPACPDDLAFLLEHVTPVDTTGMDKYAKAERWVDELERMRNLVGITDVKLGNYGVTEADCEHMARYCYNDFCEEGHPRDLWEPEVEAFMKSML
jgi:alcohol dehydrogenase class IV